MARQHSYSGVSFEGYVGFWAVLQASPWSSVPVAGALQTGTLDPAATFGLTVLPWCRLMLLRAVRAAADISNGTSVTVDLDTAWDNAQARLDLMIAAAQRSSDPAEQSAATRLRTALLPTVANTRGATQLSYAQEVDYGMAQEVQAAKPDVHADIVLTGLTSVVAQASSATRALAEAVGASTGTTHRLTLRAEQVAARRACNNAFTVVHDVLLTTLAATASGPVHTTATAMFQTMSDLLTRYPTTPVHTVVHTPAAAPSTTGNPDVTIVPAGTGTTPTVTAAGPTATVSGTVAPTTTSTTTPTAPTTPRHARKTTPRTVRLLPAAKKHTATVKKTTAKPKKKPAKAAKKK